MLNVPVKTFSHVGTEPQLPGYYQHFFSFLFFFSFFFFFFLGGGGGVNILAQEHNTATRVGLEPPTSGSGVRGVNHQATAPPSGKGVWLTNNS